MFDATTIAINDAAAVDVRGSATARLPPPFVRRSVPVTSILVREGFDQDFITSYIDMLAEIVREYGLRDPITITADGRLIAGARWFAAVRKLGWETVEVAVVKDAA
jgi:ParB-like chromosome segregation protein Spo0J